MKKNAEKWKYITVKLMIELGFKLGVVSFFHFSHPHPPSRFPLPAPRFPLPVSLQPLPAAFPSVGWC